MPPEETEQLRARMTELDPKIPRIAPLTNLEVKDSGADSDSYTIKGHAAVFNIWADLWWFREKIEPGAFSNVLSRDPDVHCDWDHNTLYVLGRTRNKTLELQEDERGLKTWARVAPTSYAQDLRVLLERGDIDQMSFMFTVKEDKWEIEGEEDDRTVSRTIIEIENLYDVTVCAQGAYSTTDVGVARSLAINAFNSGRLPAEARAIFAAQADPADELLLAARNSGDEKANRQRLDALKARARASRLTSTPV